MRHLLPLPFVLIGLAAGTQPAGPTVGFVLSIDGPWLVHNRAIRQGETVPAGVRVLLAAGTTFDPGRSYWIDIVLLDSSHKSLRCSSAQACRTGLLMPGSVVQQSSFGTRLADAFSRIFTTPERYVGLMSRGSEGPRGRFVDGVAKLDGGRLQLSPFFQGADVGGYGLNFERVMPPPEPAAPHDALHIVWDRSAASASPSTSLGPGLYRVTLMREGSPEFGPFESWILVVPAAEFDAAGAAYDEAMRAVRGWDRNVPPKDVAMFRHAFLAQLAASRR